MDRRTDLLIELLSGQVHQAPGSRASTERALTALDPLPANPIAVDLGCGRGASVRTLAEVLRGPVLAVDRVPAMVAAACRAVAEADRPRVHGMVADIGALPIRPGVIDVLWSEGAAYAIGFEVALRRWRALLRPGVGVGITELCWRTTTPPDAAAAWWRAAYPAMRSADECRAAFTGAGFDLVESFLLPDEDWAAYYEPIEARLPAFREQYRGDADAIAVADELAAEITAWREWGAHFGYVFLVGRASG